MNDVCAAYAALRERGVTFIREPRPISGPMWGATFEDPDGHKLTISGPERSEA